MSFWTGLEAFTGHRPGAFTGMTMKGLFDKDMWDRMPRTWSGQRTPTGPTDIRTGRAGEPMMTNWARGGGSGPTDSENQNIDRQMQGLYQQNLGPYPSMDATYPEMPAQVQTRALPPRPNLNPTPLSPFIPGVSSNQGLNSIRQWGTQNPNMPGSMALDPTWAGGTRGAGLNAQTTTPSMLDMTTVKKITDDASPNTITQTIKQKVPDNPTKTLMNMNQPGFLENLGLGIGKFYSDGWDNSILGQGFDVGKRFSDRAAKGWDAMKDLSRKRYEEEMLQRQRGY